MTASILAGLAGAMALAASGVYLRYRRDLNAARARLAVVDRHVISTRWGVVEYAERGYGGAFVSNADVNDYKLEAINVPTLIVHTKDDQVASHEASQRAAERIPGARLVSLESGGHLMIGQTKIVRDELARFFAETPNRGVKRVAS